MCTSGVAPPPWSIKCLENTWTYDTVPTRHIYPRFCTKIVLCVFLEKQNILKAFLEHSIYFLYSVWVYYKLSIHSGRYDFYEFNKIGFAFLAFVFIFL